MKQSIFYWETREKKGPTKEPTHLAGNQFYTKKSEWTEGKTIPGKSPQNGGGGGMFASNKMSNHHTANALFESLCLPIGFLFQDARDVSNDGLRQQNSNFHRTHVKLKYI